MAASERGSNPPGGGDGGGGRDPELDHTLPDGGPDLPASTGASKDEVKPQLKRTMMGIDSDAAKKLRELAAAADAARAKSKAASAASEASEAESAPDEKPEEKTADAKAEAKAEEKLDAAKAEEKPAEAKADEKPDEAKAEEKPDEAKAEEKPDEAKADAKAEEQAEEKPAEKPEAAAAADNPYGDDWDEEDDDEFDAPTQMLELDMKAELLARAAKSEDGGEDAGGDEEKADDTAEADADAKADEGGQEPAEEAEPESTAGIRVQYFGRTHVGLIRDHNEDNYTVVDVDADVRGTKDDTPRKAGIGPRGAVFAVCDGMGGAAAGEVASQMAVDTVHEYFSTLGLPKSVDHFAQRVIASIEEAGHRIFSAAKMDRSRRGMGTTATVAGLIDKKLFVGQVGDSRAYVLRGGELGLITKDQSLVNQLIEAGQLTEEEAEAFEHSNIILQALGTTEDVTVDLTFLELRKGDRLMLCSDGLSGLVHAEVIKDVMASTPDLVECSDKLIEMANAGGGHDNITVVVVDFDGDDLEEAEPGQNPMYVQYPLPPGLEEDRESLAPREINMKAGGRKPGADVKRSSDDAGSEHGAADGVAAPMNWGVILGALVLIVIIVAVIVASREGSDDSPDEDSQLIVPDPTDDQAGVEQLDVVEELTQVRIETDIEGELYIDGEPRGELSEGQPVVVDLAPGAYRFEAFSGDDVVAEATVSVTLGEPMDVALMLPSGATEVAAEPDDRVEESGGTSNGAGSNSAMAGPEPDGPDDPGDPDDPEPTMAAPVDEPDTATSTMNSEPPQRETTMRPAMTGAASMTGSAMFIPENPF